jgi:hypothetical protein
MMLRLNRPSWTGSDSVKALVTSRIVVACADPLVSSSSTSTRWNVALNLILSPPSLLAVPSTQ